MPRKSAPRARRSGPKRHAKAPPRAKTRRASQSATLTASGLEPEHELFALEFLKDHCATTAYLRSVNPHTTRGTAATEGGRLLRRPEIADFIRQKHREAVQKVEVEVEDILRELVAVGFSNLRYALDPVTGALLPMGQMPDQTQRAIASLKVTKKNLTAGDGEQEDVVEVKTWPKVAALELLARHKGILIDRVERGGPGEFAQMSREQLDAELEALRSVQEARDASRRQAEAVTPPKKED